MHLNPYLQQQQQQMLGGYGLAQPAVFLGQQQFPMAYQQQPVLVGMMQQQQQSVGAAYYTGGQYATPQQMLQQQLGQQSGGNSWDPVMSTNLSHTISSTSAYSTNVSQGKH